MASRGVNKVILLGNCGRDPEPRNMPSGGSVVNLTLATSESWKDKSTGDPKERTEWHSLVFYNQLADIVAKYVKKGMRLYIEGSLRTRKWTDRDNNDRYTTEIVVNDMQMLGGRGQDQESQASGSQRTEREPESVTSAAESDDELGDSIPF